MDLTKFVVGARVIVVRDGMKGWVGKRGSIVGDLFYDLGAPHVYVRWDGELKCDHADCTINHTGQKMQCSIEGIRVLPDEQS